MYRNRFCAVLRSSSIRLLSVDLGIGQTGYPAANVTGTGVAVTANDSDRDRTAGTSAGNESPQAGSTPGAWDPAGDEAGYASQTGQAGQAESAPGALPGGLTSGSLVPGMAVRSPALDYMLGKQRRRVRNVAAVAASILAIGVVAAAVTIAAHNGGGRNAGSAQLTAAQVVQQAARQQSSVNWSLQQSASTSRAKSTRPSPARSNCSASPCSWP